MSESSERRRLNRRPNDVSDQPIADRSFRLSAGVPFATRPQGRTWSFTYRVALMLLDTAVILLAVSVAVILRFNSGPLSINGIGFNLVGLAMIVLWFGLLIGTGCYDHRIFGVGADEFKRIFTELEDQMRAKLAACGFAPEASRIARYLDCRYHRQISTIEIPVAEEALRLDSQDWIKEPFEAKYRQYFGHVHANESPFVETCRVVAYGLVPGAALSASGGAAGAYAYPRPASFSERRMIFTGEWTQANVFWFDELAAGTHIEGPALVESTTTTVLLPAGNKAEVDEFGSLRISEEDAA